MLQRLAIQDFVIVEKMEIEFESGFTVFTGETGAGKSILVDALALALGERSDASIVRQGAERAVIEAEFSISDMPGFCAWLREADLDGDEGACLLRRIVDVSGRSRSYVNGRSVTLQQLREAGEFLVDIHGQHAHQSLLKPIKQQEMLDSLASAEKLASDVSAAYRQWSAIRKARQQFEANRAETESQREQLAWQVSELSHLAFDPAEWEDTLHEQARLAHAASLIDGASHALDVLGEMDDSCLSRLGAVDSRLAALEEYDSEIKAIRPLLDSAQIQITEAVYSLRHYVDRLDLDPGRLQALEARVDAVHSAVRKFRVTPGELPGLLEKLKSHLSELDGAGDIESLLQKEQEAGKIYADLALALSAARRAMADKLGREVTESMQLLSMTGGAFEVFLDALPEGDSHGMERVEFLVAAHPGTPLRPLSKVASGGELSRISLAIQVMGSNVQRVPTLIFDEVDVGIGGGVAEIVGRLLSRLGNDRQVLCVTHLPQVASLAAWQFSVSKESGKSRTLLLGREGRVEEIARMLGGVEITETTRSHAREMLGF